MRIVQMNLQAGWGGGEAMVFLLGRALAGSGAEVSFGCLPGSALGRRAAESGLEVWDFSARNQFSVSGALRLARRLRALKPDVLHLHTAREYFVGALAGRLAGVPCIVITRHMALPVKPLMRPVYNSLSHRVACVSHAVREEVVRSGVPAERTKVIHGAIDQTELRGRLIPKADARARLGLKPEVPLVGTIGSLTPAKGVADFLRAAALLVQQGFGGDFVIAGDGPARAEFEGLAAELALEKRVRFTGFAADVGPILSALDAFVLPTRDTEALGLVLIEAMTAGVPVVATTPRGGVTEIVEHEVSGLLSPPRDPAGLARAMQRVLDEPGLRDGLVEKAAGRIAHFDVPRMTREYEMLYREVLETR